MSTTPTNDLGNINTVFVEDDLTISIPNRPNGDENISPAINNPQKEIEEKNEEQKPGKKRDDESVEENMDEVENENNNLISNTQNGLKQFFCKNKSFFKRLVFVLFVGLYIFYFIYALYHSFGDEGSIRLVWVTSLGVVAVSLFTLHEKYYQCVHSFLLPLLNIFQKHSFKINLFCLVCIFLVFISMLILDFTYYNTPVYNLVSLGGLIFYIFFCFITSAYPLKINWRTIAWGFGLQYLMAMLVLRWEKGYMGIKWLGDRFDEYLEHIVPSCVFLFGSSYTDHQLLMKSLPTFVLINCTVSVLIYIGILQFIIIKIAQVMEMTMGTTVGESVNATGNIFISFNEILKATKHIISLMTYSEIHAVMTAGFATVPANFLAIYVQRGVAANHLISASLMSVPAALTISKLYYPETIKIKNSSKDVIKMPQFTKSSSLIESISSAAISSISLVSGILVIVIANVSFLDFINSTLTWFGNRVGSSTPITFQVVCSYLFWPLSFSMGVNMEDCGRVAALIGMKIIINPLLSYAKLGILIKNQKIFNDHVLRNGTWNFVNGGHDIQLENFTANTNTVLSNGFINKRSVVIATYALCGLSNIAFLPFQIAAVSQLVPTKKMTFVKVSFQAFVAGNIACIITACFAGLFYRSN